MDEVHFFWYCAAMVAFVIWLQLSRGIKRVWRVLGAVAIVAGLGRGLPWVLQHFRSN
jgi:hypothetical protein